MIHELDYDAAVLINIPYRREYDAIKKKIYRAALSANTYLGALVHFRF
jgi:hypothetical protein